MGLPTFGMLMMCMVLSFSPPDVFRAWLDTWLHGDAALVSRQLRHRNWSKRRALAVAH